jgi:uncharacterized protein YndB with AHSA1/START domain
VAAVRRGWQQRAIRARLRAVKEITLVQDFAAPVERVFAALADQDAMGAWMGGQISVPTRGKDGLVGTVRRIHLGPTWFEERIVECEPPRFIAYQIVTRVPLLQHHRGEMHIEPHGAGQTRLTWRIVLELKPAFVGALLLGPLGLTVKRGLRRLSHSLTH